MAGKGSRARPKSVSNDKFAANWDAIFSKKKEESTELKTDESIIPPRDSGDSDDNIHIL